VAPDFVRAVLAPLAGRTNASAPTSIFLVYRPGVYVSYLN